MSSAKAQVETPLAALKDRTLSSLPRAGTTLVRRPRLDARLSRASRRPVTVISASPGTGKTTLLAEWAQHQRRDHLRWLTIDSTHNDVRRLLHDLCTALVGTEPPASVRRRRPADVLAWALAAMDLGHGNVILILDAVQELLAPEALSVLTQVIEALPPRLDLIIASRADPIVPGRLRLDGRLAEIRGADLAFTLEEAEQLFAVHGVEVKRSDLIAMWRQTEGWAAPLVLAANAMKEGAQPSTVAHEGVVDAAVSDYLLSEVLERLDPDEREFLFRTSVVDRINGDLAEALCEDADAPRRLAEQERRGLFMVALDDGEWYRYHPLVATLLRARFHRFDPQQLRRLDDIAALWFNAHGMPAIAEQHAIAAESWRLFGDLVGRRFLDAVASGASIASFAADLADDRATKDPVLAAVASAVASSAGNTAEAGRLLRETHGSSHEHLMETLSLDSPIGASVVLAAELLYGCAAGASEVSVAAARALSSVKVEPRLRAFGKLRRAELLLERGDLRGARILLEGIDDPATDPGLVSQSRALLALVLAVEGHAAGALHLAAAASEQHDEQTAAILSLAAAVATAQIRDDGASSLGDSGVDALLAGSSVLSMCLRLLREVRNDQVWVDTAAGRSRWAQVLLTALGVTEVLDTAGMRMPVGGQAEASLRDARRALAAHEYGNVLEATGPWVERGARVEAHPRTRAELATLGAVAAAALDQRAAGADYLEVALETAAVYGTSGPIKVRAAELNGALITYAGSAARHHDLAVQLLDEARPAEMPVYVEQLTDRETLVLQYLPTLMSNVEIAEALSLSVNTVKTHLKALYRKLGVDRRRDAVIRGRQLHVL